MVWTLNLATDLQFLQLGGMNTLLGNPLRPISGHYTKLTCRNLSFDRTRFWFWLDRVTITWLCEIIRYIVIFFVYDLSVLCSVDFLLNVQGIDRNAAGILSILLEFLDSSRLHRFQLESVEEWKVLTNWLSIIVATLPIAMWCHSSLAAAGDMAWQHHSGHIGVCHGCWQWWVMVVGGGGCWWQWRWHGWHGQWWWLLRKRLLLLMMPKSSISKCWHSIWAPAMVTIPFLSVPISILSR